MTENRINAAHTAKAILVNLAEYCGEKGKELSRFRISRDSLKIAANRKTLKEAFVVDVIDEMAQHGWSCIDVGTMTTNNELAFIQTPKVAVWPRLGVNRVRKLVGRKGSLDDVHEAISEEYEYHYPEQASEFEAFDD